MEVVGLDKDALMRKLLFVPCHTQEALARWIRLYLGLDIPDCLVDPSSTISPMGFIWEVYERALKGDDPSYSTVLAYASRFGGKTLGAAILEVLMLCHLDRSVAHLAAIEQQAARCSSYVKGFLTRPFLRDFLVGDNKRDTVMRRYVHRNTEDVLTPKEWKALPEPEQAWYEEKSTDIKILVCTMQSTQGEHPLFLCVDELDVIQNPRAYQEAKLIPAPRDGKMPITMLTSTRKAYGLVQQEIDAAPETGLRVHHWNALDVTEACPASRHRPDLPKISIWRSDETLRALSEQQFEDTPQEQKKLYVKDEGYVGCLSNCKLFAVCRTRLVTEQKSKSPMLKPIADTINKFRSLSVDMAKAQLLCWRPSVEGLIYPRLDRNLHMLTPAAMAAKITGQEHPANLGKQQLTDIMLSRGMNFVAGMDFGFTHNFAVVLAAIENGRAYVFEVISAPQLELAQKIDLCEQRQIKRFEPTIYPDMADPSSIKTFRKHGFKMRDWKKAPHSVMGGIEVVRMKLSPTLDNDPELYFLKDDPGCELLVKYMMQYHFLTDAAGVVTSVPDESNDDEADACRYLIQNAFATGGKIVVGPDLGLDSMEIAGIVPTMSQQMADKHFERQQEERLRAVKELHERNPGTLPLQEAIDRSLGTVDDAQQGAAEQGPRSGKKGKFVWNLD